MAGGVEGAPPWEILKLGCKTVHSGHFRHCVKKVVRPKKTPDRLLCPCVSTVMYCRGHGNPVARLAAPRRWPCSRSVAAGRIGSTSACNDLHVHSVPAEGAGPGQSTGFPCPLQYMYEQTVHLSCGANCSPEVCVFTSQLHGQLDLLTSNCYY